MKKLYVGFCVLLLIYMIMPGPSQISDFKALPQSDKSTLAGDNIAQVSNVAAYFSDNYRKFVVDYYLGNYHQNTWLPFPPLKLNHPPEYSWLVIKKHTDSTYIEELVYPLRDSIYVNGFEPFYPDSTPKFWGSTRFVAETDIFFTKTTLRFYPSNIVVRIIVWFGIISSIYLLFRLGRKILK